jgi:type IV pilus assembly protein PilC
MAEFVCRVADGNGRVYALVEAAADHGEVRQKLVDRGLYVYSVQPRSFLLPGWKGRTRKGTVSGSKFLILNQQFNTLIKAGLPILKSLDLLAERAAEPKLRPIISQVRDRVREGKSLSEAVAESGSFSKVYATAVLAGEKSGNLSGVLDQFIAYQRVSTSVKKRIIATLIYPAILITSAVLIVSYLITFVIPQFAKLYQDLNVELPATTQFLIAMTVEYRTALLLSILFFVLAVAGVFLWSRTEAGGERMDRLKFRIPAVGDTLLKFQVAQFSRTLATLLGGGTPLVSALQTSVEAISSPLVRNSVTEATQRVREGQSLHNALAVDRVVPALALDMIEVGESSGALSPMLNSVAEFYEEEVAIRLSTLIAAIEPAILIFMALFVAFILISLYLPMFSIQISGGGH